MQKEKAIVISMLVGRIKKDARNLSRSTQISNNSAVHDSRVPHC